MRVVNRTSPSRATAPLQRVYTDFWGPYSVPTLSGAVYALTFTDDYTRHCWVYTCKARSELYAIFTAFKTTVELESGHRIKVLRADNALEYKALAARLQASGTGIQVEFTTTYTPEQNGVAERLNRSLFTVARAMLSDARLPIRFWGEAVATACYLRNRTPIGPEGKTPFQAFIGRKPDLQHLRAYGCLAYAHVPKEHRKKLDSVRVRCILVGYMPTARQYRLYEPVSAQIIVATAPIFSEDKRLQWNWPEDLPGDTIVDFDPMEAPITAPTGPREPEEPEEGDTIVVDTGDMPTEATRGLENPEGPEPDSEDTIIVDTGEVAPQVQRLQAPPPNTARRQSPRLHQHQAMVATIAIPRTYHEAVNDSLNGAHWKQAISEELTKLQALDTWKYTKLLPGQPTVGCKWVFTVKYTPTGLIDRYKARLVAQGFSQTEGTDFLETTSNRCF